MGIEIERRYLVEGSNWTKYSYKSNKLRQGYLATSIDSWNIRIRVKDNDQAWITLKAPAQGFAQHEFEYSIPLEDAESLWRLATHQITKIRHSLNINGIDARVFL